MPHFATSRISTSRHDLVFDSGRVSAMRTRRLRRLPRSARRARGTSSTGAPPSCRHGAAGACRPGRRSSSPSRSRPPLRGAPSACRARPRASAAGRSACVRRTSRSRHGLSPSRPHASRRSPSARLASCAARPGQQAPRAAGAFGRLGLPRRIPPRSPALWAPPGASASAAGARLPRRARPRSPPASAWPAPRSAAGCRRPWPPARRPSAPRRLWLVLLFFGHCPLSRPERPLALQRQDAGDLSLGLLEARGVVERTGGVLEAQVEQLLPTVHELLLELVVGHLSQLARSHSSFSRVTNFVLIGSFRPRAAWPPWRAAPRPGQLEHRRVPGLTTATQCSGEPLPEPIRVSAGFWLTGLSGRR